MKKFKYIFSVIFLGSLGSALWEIALRPFVKIIFSAIISVMIFLSSGFENNIYKLASYGFYEAYSLQLYLMSYAILISLYIVLIFTYSKNGQTYLESMDDKEPLDELNRPQIYYKLVDKFLSKKIKAISFVIVLLLGLYNGAIHTTVNKVITETQNNIKILAPHISDNDYKMLISKFHSMDNKDDYLRLIKDISDYGSIYNIEFKEYPSNFYKY